MSCCPTRWRWHSNVHSRRAPRSMAHRSSAHTCIDFRSTRRPYKRRHLRSPGTRRAARRWRMCNCHHLALEVTRRQTRLPGALRRHRRECQRWSLRRWQPHSDGAQKQLAASWHADFEWTRRPQSIARFARPWRFLEHRCQKAPSTPRPCLLYCGAAEDSPARETGPVASGRHHCWCRSCPHCSRCCGRVRAKTLAAAPRCSTPVPLRWREPP